MAWTRPRATNVETRRFTGQVGARCLHARTHARTHGHAHVKVSKCLGDNTAIIRIVGYEGRVESCCMLILDPQVDPMAKNDDGTKDAAAPSTSSILPKM